MHKYTVKHEISEVPSIINRSFSQFIDLSRLQHPYFKFYLLYKYISLLLTNSQFSHRITCTLSSSTPLLNSQNLLSHHYTPPTTYNSYQHLQQINVCRQCNGHCEHCLNGQLLLITYTTSHHHCY
jgi:hypothetical protein